MDGSLTGLYHALHEWIGWLIKYEGEADVQTGYPEVVLHHLHLHHILTRTWITHGGESIYNQFGINFHMLNYLCDNTSLGKLICSPPDWNASDGCTNGIRPEVSPHRAPPVCLPEAIGSKGT